MKRTVAGRRMAIVAIASLLLLGSVAAPASAAPKQNPTKLAEKLVKQVTSNGANRHLIALQRIADRNGGNRAVDDGRIGSTSAGYNASVDYVAGRLKAWGFIVETPDFTYTVSKVDATSVTVGGTGTPSTR